MPTTEEYIAWLQHQIQRQTGQRLEGNDLQRYINDPANAKFINDSFGSSATALSIDMARQRAAAQNASGPQNPGPGSQYGAFGQQSGQQAGGANRTVGNVNWEAVGAFYELSPADQAALTAQGLGARTGSPIVSPSLSVGGMGKAADPRSGISSLAGGTAQPAFHATGGFMQGPIPNAMQQGFQPQGPSGEWAGQAMNFMNAGIARNAVAAEGAINNLEQSAAARGDLDRLDYKKARLRRQLEAGRRSSGLLDAMQQVQLAQAMAQPFADSPGVAAFRERTSK